MYVIDGQDDDDWRDDEEDAGDGVNDYYDPSTNVAREPIPIWSAKSYISGHVILNNCGTRLIRKNRPLKPKVYQQAAFWE